MRNNWPVSEEDIDDFFKTELAEAQDDSFLNSSSWDKIAQQLDVLDKIPVQFPETNSVSAVTESIVTKNSSLIANYFLTVKGLVITGAVVSSSLVLTYIYFSNGRVDDVEINKTLDLNKAVITDSLENSSKSIEEVVNTSNGNINNQPKSTIDSKIVNEPKVENPTIDAQLSNTGSTVKEEVNLVQDNPITEPISPTNNSSESKNETNVDQEVKDQSNVPVKEEKAKDFREKQLENARKKSRPIFTPQN